MLVMTYNNIRNKFVVALCACFCKVMASDCYTFVFFVILPKKSTQKSKALDKLDQ